MTSVKLGLARTVALAERPREPGALSAVAGLATREELAKAPVSSVLLEFVMKGVVKISETMVSNVSVRQVTLGRGVRKVCSILLTDDSTVCSGANKLIVESCNLELPRKIDRVGGSTVKVSKYRTICFIFFLSVESCVNLHTRTPY